MWGVFQFTHPVRGATPRLARMSSGNACFNSRTPCGVRLWYCIMWARGGRFQFTHPVRGATYVPYRLLIPNYVSIHAPRAGCDCQVWISIFSLVRFNSRTPCGVRQFDNCFTCFSGCFNSRTPCGVRHRCPKVRINRRLDVDPLRIEDYKRVCRCVGGDCEAVCACISTCANSLPFL